MRNPQKLVFAAALGKRLAVMRGNASQKAFARSLGIHKNTLIRYEQGERLPNALVLAQLHTIHGVNVLWLLTGFTR